MIDFSVIVPAYNAEEYIRDTIESILKQHGVKFEVIVIDDGSTDNTRIILDKYITNENIKYFYIENSGPGEARNNGIRRSQGRFIVFCDSDDLLHEDCLCVIKSVVDMNPKVGFIFTNYDIFDNDGIISNSGVDIWKTFRSIPMSDLGNGICLFRERLTKYVIKMGGFYHMSGATINRQYLDMNNLFLKGYYYGEDDEFISRIAYRCDSIYIDKILSRKRTHSGSIIHDNRNRFRNIWHYMEITNKQIEYFREDSEISGILDKKKSILVREYIYALETQNMYPETKEFLKKHRFENYYQYMKLYIKNRCKHMLYCLAQYIRN